MRIIIIYMQLFGVIATVCKRVFSCNNKQAYLKPYTSNDVNISKSLKPSW